MPQATYFKPRNSSSGLTINLNLDELEAIRLVDLENLSQIKAAQKMKVSQSTLQRILNLAHQKTAQALVEGRAIELKGGEIKMIGFGRGGGRGLGRGRGIGGGRGRMGGAFAAGPGGVCVCTNPDCKHKESHQLGVPCFQRKCPKCGSPMIRSN